MKLGLEAEGKPRPRAKAQNADATLVGSGTNKNPSKMTKKTRASGTKKGKSPKVKEEVGVKEEFEDSDQGTISA